MELTTRGFRAGLLSLVAAALLGLGFPAAAAAAPRSALPGTLRLQTVPPLPNVTVKVDGATATSDTKGRIKVRVRNFTGLDNRLVVPEARISSDRRAVFDRFRGSLDSGVRGKVVELGLRTSRMVSWSFLDRFGDVVPARRVKSMRLRSNTGEILDLRGADLTQPCWVAESRTQQGPRGLVSKRLYYVVDTAMVDGTSVVNRAGQKFVPWEQRSWVVQLLFFKVSFSASDLIFPRRAGEGIQLTRADGSLQRLAFAPDGTALVPDLPRGTYTVSVLGGGVSFQRPVSISKDQRVELTVISVLDLVLVVGAILAVALGLVLVGRPRLRGWIREQARFVVTRLGAVRRHGGLRHPKGSPVPGSVEPAGAGGSPDRGERPRPRRRAGALLLVLFTALAATLPPSHPARADLPAAPMTTPAAVPVLAYYYIWFNPTSWNRAKVDYPLLGRYSSDDVEIMRRHVRMAKSAGINGFLVSWKHTPQLDERLAKLVEVARAENFRLGIVYQGLDFSRNPLSFDTVRADLELFASRYASDPVFDIFGKPVVIWSGSDRFSARQIDHTVRDVRKKLLVLGNAKNLKDVESNEGAVDGQAYYWSSVDPTTDKSAGKKLETLSRAVHLRGGLWIAPVAPGFDARLVGGEREVPRRDGDTLRASFAVARRSQSDAIGVISWNEFSENTHIEPSQRFGASSITVLADLLGVDAEVEVPMDSSDPSGGRHWGLPAWAALVSTGTALVLLPVWVLMRRRRARLGGAAGDGTERPG